MDLALPPDAPSRHAGPGLFITFDGGDGCGKTTHIHALATLLEEELGTQALLVREPGGTAVGESIREVLLDPAHGEMDMRCELLLYEAARAQIVHEVVMPALEAGKTVLCDRFIDSTVAYQGYGRGIAVSEVAALNGIAIDGCVPDRTVVFELDPKLGVSRATLFGADRLESEGESFHARVHEGFAAIVASGAPRIRVIHTREDRVDTAMAVLAALDGVIELDLDAIRGKLAGNQRHYFGDL